MLGELVKMAVVASFLMEGLNLIFVLNLVESLHEVLGVHNRALLTKEVLAALSAEGARILPPVLAAVEVDVDSEGILFFGCGLSLYHTLLNLTNSNY